MNHELPSAQTVAPLWLRCKAFATSQTVRMVVTIGVLWAMFAALLVAIAHYR